MIAIQGLPVNAETGMIDAGGAGVGFGFLGGIVGGFLAGYVILLLEKVFSKIPASLNGLKAIFLYPLCSTAIVGLVMLGISGPMAAINQGMMDFLQSLGNSGPVILGLAIGCMCAFDMGGPVNKAAYATGTFLLGTALEAGVGTETYNFGTNFMAAVSAACIVPPLITTFAVVVGKKYFSQEDHDAGIVNLILGCTHITEGAIPFMTKNIWPVMPIMMLGSSIASILTIFFNVHDPAPHGGFLVLPVVENGPLWVLAILIGAVVGGILFVAFKKYDFEKNQKAAPVARSVEAPKAAAVEAPKEEAADFVKVENVFVAEDFASRDEALSFVSNQAVKAGIASDADAVMNAFLAREAEGTTGMMEGFAIPHAKSRRHYRGCRYRRQGRLRRHRLGHHGRRSRQRGYRPAHPRCPGWHHASQDSVQGRRGAHGRGLPCHRQGFHQRRRDRQDDQRPPGLIPRYANTIAPCIKGLVPLQGLRLFLSLP